MAGISPDTFVGSDVWHTAGRGPTDFGNIEHPVTGQQLRDILLQLNRVTALVVSALNRLEERNGR